MDFRKTKLSEKQGIVKLFEDGRKALGARGINQWQSTYPGYQEVDQDIARGESYVVENQGSLIATAMLGFSAEADYNSLQNGTWLTANRTSKPPYISIHRVVVGTPYKGRGVASFILEEAEKLAAAAGRESVRIDTHRNNTNMRSLLKKHGYTECGIILISHEKEDRAIRIAYEKLIRQKQDCAV